MNELSLKVKQNPGAVELNFDELEQALELKLKEYKGAVFTEESKDIAKGELASLRKLRKDFEDARKGVKKEWMKPYDAFETQMKKLTAKIDEPIQLIDSQLKDFEEKRRAEKKKTIVAVYEELVGDAREYCPLEVIYDRKWENATTTMKSIKTSIAEAVESVKKSVEIISGMQSDAVGRALELYKSTLDMAKAIAYINDYERQKAEIVKREEEKKRKEEERRRIEEEERIRAQERAAVEREKQIRESAIREAEAMHQEAVQGELDFSENEKSGDEILPFVQPSTRSVVYRVVGTEEELEQIDIALDSIGVYFERRDA